MYRWVFYPLGKVVLALFFLLFGPVRVRGRERVPRRGGLLVVANHLSDIDPPLVGHALPRPAWFMAKSELFSVPILGPVMRAFRAFPVKRGRPDRAAIRRAVELLQAGECVVVFPEGQISEDGRLQRALAGAALIWKHAQVTCVVCGIAGSQRIVPFRSVIPRPAFGGVSVRFGEPIPWERASEIESFGEWFTGEAQRLTGLPLPEDAVEVTEE
ncbi:MAG: lysophospholipid acyltransferase family protein [Armatimonadota bacterium]